jgi:hypothetical protein
MDTRCCEGADRLTDRRAGYGAPPAIPRFGAGAWRPSAD